MKVTMPLIFLLALICAPLIRWESREGNIPPEGEQPTRRTSQDSVAARDLTFLNDVYTKALTQNHWTIYHRTLSELMRKCKTFPTIPGNARLCSLTDQLERMAILQLSLCKYPGTSQALIRLIAEGLTSLSDVPCQYIPDFLSRQVAFLWSRIGPPYLRPWSNSAYGYSHPPWPEMWIGWDNCYFQKLLAVRLPLAALLRVKGWREIAKNIVEKTPPNSLLYCAALVAFALLGQGQELQKAVKQLKKISPSSLLQIPQILMALAGLPSDHPAKNKGIRFIAAALRGQLVRTQEVSCYLLTDTISSGWEIEKESLESTVTQTIRSILLRGSYDEAEDQGLLIYSALASVAYLRAGRLNVDLIKTAVNASVSTDSFLWACYMMKCFPNYKWEGETLKQICYNFVEWLRRNQKRLNYNSELKCWTLKQH